LTICFGPKIEQPKTVVESKSSLHHKLPSFVVV
jgi:hypothetical protein